VSGALGGTSEARQSVSGPPPSVGGVVFVAVLVAAVTGWMAVQRPQSEVAVDMDRLTRLTASLGELSGFRSDAWFLPDDELLGFVEVPAGPFLMGSDPAIDRLAFDNEWWPGVRPQATLDLPSFYVGRYEVTVAQFAAFVEETGYRAGRLEALGPIWTTPGFTDEQIYLFAAHELEEVGQELQDDEVIELHPMPLERALAMVWSGELSDAKSALALLHAARHVGCLA